MAVRITHSLAVSFARGIKHLGPAHDEAEFEAASLVGRRPGSHAAGDLQAREAAERDAEHAKQSARSTKALGAANAAIAKLRRRESPDVYRAAYGEPHYR